MDIRQLKYFIAVADYKSLTAAAEALNVTQPALGMQVRKLEEYLDTPLVERHSRGVHLTQAGELLRRHADVILETFSKAEQELRRFSKTPSGTVRIGVTPSLGRVLVPTLLEACADRHPDTKLLFSQGFTDQLDSQLTNLAIDFALTHTMLDNDRFESVPLYVETICLIGTPDLLSNASDPMSVAELVEMPLALDERSQHVRRIIDRALDGEGLEFRDMVEIQAINIRRELVMQGRRCSISPLALFAAELEAGLLKAVAIDIPELTRILHLAGHRVEKMTPAEAAVRALILELVDADIAAGRFGWLMPTD